jgi:hypothetical protein
MHEVAFVEVHIRMEVPPPGTAAGTAAKSTVGRGFTVTMVIAGALAPPGPVQVRINVAVAVSVPELCEPLTPSVPLHAPEAMQDVAFVEVHISMVDSPAAIDVSDACIDTVAGGLTEAAPPQAQSSSTQASNKNRTMDRMAYLWFFAWYVAGPARTVRRFAKSVAYN